MMIFDLKKLFYFLTISLLFATFSISLHHSADASSKEHENFFMSRARYAAHATCSRRNEPANYEACRENQMRAAKRIVARNKQANSKRLLNKTLECLQTIQVLPVKIRKQGLLWVENCIR